MAIGVTGAGAGSRGDHYATEPKGHADRTVRNPLPAEPVSKIATADVAGVIRTAAQRDELPAVHTGLFRDLLAHQPVRDRYCQRWPASVVRPREPDGRE